MPSENNDNDFVMTPWEVKGDIDYSKLVEEFGTELINSALLERFEKHAGELHFLLKRGVYFSHRDMNWVFDVLERGDPFYLYNGRGPSAHIHLGHYTQFVFTKWMQDKFKCPYYFQLTDDEKFLFNRDLDLDKATNYGFENALDLIATGFDPDLTDIIIDTKHSGVMYPLAIKVAKKVTFSTCKAVFGFTNSSNIGQIFYTSYQAVPAFIHSVRVGKNVPCVIPLAIDQDAHFRVTRDVVNKLGYYKPAILHSVFLPGLQQGGKMSASDPSSALYTVDPPKTIKKKIRSSFTGGRDTATEQRELGGQPDICPVYWHYKMVFVPDDNKLEELERLCKSGEMLCGECKSILIDLATKHLTEHQERREKAKDKLEDFLLKTEDFIGKL
ncbi:MAG: tryptophan--tRNA ligase [Candidatus Hodarchaeales archaeon]|jgi:tryptophanyl-tRNA synthetase